MSHPLVERILYGNAPLQLKQAAARGALPIPREDLIELWVLLRNDPDGEVRIACKENLAGVTEREWKDTLPDYPYDARVLDFAVRVLGKNLAVLLAVLRNKYVADETFEWLAGHGQGSALDAVLDNQVRLLRHPPIVSAMLGNEHIDPSQVRRVFDLAEQFFREHSQIPALLESRFGLKMGAAGGAFGGEIQAEVAEVVGPLPEGDLAEVSLEDLLAAFGGTKLAELELPVEALSGDPLSQEEFENLFKRILNMSVPAKISLAVRGNKEARGLLIRDSNKVVQMAVINSPKITDSEVEGMAKMRSVPDDILRRIARNKEWMKKYPIMKGLATNPKTPPGIAIQLLNRLLDFDLKMLLKDKNVSEVVRREARRYYDIRTTRKIISYKKK